MVPVTKQLDVHLETGLESFIAFFLLDHKADETGTSFTVLYFSTLSMTTV